MFKLILFTTTWMEGTMAYVETVKQVANEVNLRVDHYDSEVNDSQSLVTIYKIKSTPTLVLLNEESGDFKKLTLIQDESEVKNWIQSNL